MKLSSRTFGVEFELFFTREDYSKLSKDNIKILRQNWNAENLHEHSLKELKREYEDAQRYEGFKGNFAAYKAKIREEEVQEQISDPDCDEYNCINFVKEILEQRLGLNWNIHEDCSIRGPITMEIVTPILKGEDGIKQIKKFLAYFGEYASVNQSTGLHVHVGAADFISKGNQGKSPEMFAAALLYYSSFEEVFDSLVKNSRRKNNNSFTKSVSNPSEVLLAFQRLQEEDVKNPANIQHERYKKLNLTAINKHKTFEFRHMHGTLDFEVVKNWIKICTSFVDMVKDEYKSWSTFLKPAVNDGTKAIEAKREITEVIRATMKRAGRLPLEKEITERIMETLKFPNYSKRFHTTMETEYFVTVTFDASGLNQIRTSQLLGKLCQNRKLRLHTYSPYISWMASPRDTFGEGVRVTAQFINPMRRTVGITLTDEQKEEILAIKKRATTRTGFLKGVPTHSIKKIQEIVRLDELKNPPIIKKKAA